MTSITNIQKEINKEINSIDENETDVEKISKTANRIILMLSVKYSLNEMVEKEENNELKEDHEEKVAMFQNLIRKNYGNILEYMKKQLNIDNID